MDVHFQAGRKASTLTSFRGERLTPGERIAMDGENVEAQVLEHLVRGPHPRRNIESRQVAAEVLLAHEVTPNREKLFYFAIERYRLLSTRVLQVVANLRSKMFLLTSAIAEEGKTLTSANLAYAISNAADRRVLVIDMDLRRPSLHRLLGIEAASEPVSYFEANDWREKLWQLKPNMHALVLTSPVDNPDETLHASATRLLLEQAREEYDVVIVDSAPLLLTVDTHVLLPMMDHAMLLVRADRTPIACTRDALDMLGEKALGCILNDVKTMKYEEYYRAYYR